jgi:hypothetical protein
LAGERVERSFGGILGALAVAATLLHGLAAGAGAQSTLLRAWVALALFTPIGLVLGWLAEGVVEDSAYSRIEQELNALNQQETPKPGRRGE